MENEGNTSKIKEKSTGVFLSYGFQLGSEEFCFEPSFGTAGILCVFQGFQSEGLEQKNS